MSHKRKMLEYGKMAVYWENSNDCFTIYDVRKVSKHNPYGKILGYFGSLGGSCMFIKNKVLYKYLSKAGSKNYPPSVEGMKKAVKWLEKKHGDLCELCMMLAGTEKQLINYEDMKNESEEKVLDTLKKVNKEQEKK